MKYVLKYKRDLILIVGLLLLALCTYLGMRFYQRTSTVNAEAVVTLHGEEIGRYPLSEDAEFTVDAGDGAYNEVSIRNGKVDMVEASCPDKICVNHSKISENGETIVCLPNEVVIEIVNGEDDGVDLMTN